MPFQKGYTPWNKGISTPGRPHTTESKRKLSIAGKGRPSWNKGKKLHYTVWNKNTKGICQPNQTSFKKGQRPKNYNGGLSFYHGRWVIVCRNDKKYAYARAIVEGHLKRDLDSHEIIHHINENPADDRVENLEIVTRSIHINIHRKKLLEAKKCHP